MDLRFFGDQLRQDSAEAQRLAAERRPHQVVAGSRRVPFVEDEIEDSQHRRQPSDALFATRDLERHLLRGERSLGPDDALGDGGLRDTRNARAISSVVRPPRSRSVSATCASVESTGWQAKDEPEQIVADAIRPFVDRRLEIGHRVLFVGSSRPICSCLRSSRLTRRQWSMARFFAAAMSQAPGCAERPSPATARAPRRARPVPDPRLRRRRARSGRVRQ